MTREEFYRGLCVIKGIDPDHTCYGVGHYLEKGTSYPAWEVQQIIHKDFFDDKIDFDD
jgi:hypothetical protein